MKNEINHLFNNVTNAMQDAEEIWSGLQDQDYPILMRRIAKEANTRLKRFNQHNAITNKFYVVEARGDGHYDVTKKMDKIILNGVAEDVKNAIDSRYALQDESRYIDIIPMNNVSDQEATHNDHQPHGTEPDFYDFMVRSESLSDDTLYCEVENVPNDDVDQVEQMLKEIYKL